MSTKPPSYPTLSPLIFLHHINCKGENAPKDFHLESVSVSPAGQRRSLHRQRLQHSRNLHSLTLRQVRRRVIKLYVFEANEMKDRKLRHFLINLYKILCNVKHFFMLFKCLQGGRCSYKTLLHQGDSRLAQTVLPGGETFVQLYPRPDRVPQTQRSR